MNVDILKVNQEIELFKETMKLRYKVNVHVFFKEIKTSSLFIKDLEKIILSCLIDEHPRYSKYKSFKEHKSKKTEWVIHKQIFAYIACMKYDYAKIQIARYLDNDHSTVINNIKVIEDYFGTNNKCVQELYNRIEDKIKNYVGTISENITEQSIA